MTGALSLLGGLAIGGSVGAGFIALGLVLPGVLLQDSWRFAFIAAGDGRKAFVNDTIWAAVLIPALVAVAERGSVFAFVLAWGLPGAVAAGCGCVQARLLPALGGTSAWLRPQRDLGLRYMVENVSNSGAGQVRIYGLGAIAGLADVGVLRSNECNV